MSSRPLDRGAPVALPDDFDFEWAVRFLAARTVPALESVSRAGYQRQVRLHGGQYVVTVRYEAPAWLRVASAPDLPADVLVRMARRMLGLDADLSAFRAMAARDPFLRAVVEASPGIRLPQLLDPFEALVRAILGQQVSVAAATTMTDRLVRAIRGQPRNGRLLPFPSPEALYAAAATDIGSIGLTRAKTAAIRAAAAAVVDGTLRWGQLRSAPSEEAHSILTRVRGVGPWTASYVRMRALGDADAFPASDLGVAHALRRLCSIGERLTPSAIRRLADAWRPWRAYATLHLWNTLKHPDPPRPRSVPGPATRKRR